MATDGDRTDLRVAFIDDERSVAPGESLTFGRAADLVIDEGNRYLHRVVGRFGEHQGVWWLENLGSHIELELVGEGGTLVRVPPAPPQGSPPVAPVPGGPSTLGFEVAGARYELTLVAPARIGGPPHGAASDDHTETLSYGRITLTADERALLVLLAEPALRDRAAGSESLPANRMIAHALGWPVTKFNRKLDYLCVRLTKAGVKGLQGGRGAEASNRRWRLVEHAIATHLVTADDLR